MTPSSRRAPRSAAKPHDRQSPAPGAEFKPHNGALALFVAGRPHPALLIDLLPETPPERIAAYASEGIHLYRLLKGDLGWAAAGKSDFAALDGRVRATLSADPEAHFLLALSVDAPDWWLQANPGECVAYCLPAETPSPTPPMPSWASQRWRREAGEALARLMAHAERAEWGERCLGVQIEAGANGVWRYPEPERLPDIGPRMTEHFRTFVLSKYRRNTGLLRKAWFDTRAEFDTIVCPDARERLKTDLGVFRGLARSRRILDYYEAYYEAQNEAALHFCAIVKRASGGRMLVGLAYGFPWDEKRWQEGGHWMPEPVYDSEEVDFFVGNLSGNGLTPNTLPESLALRGKFVWLAAPSGLPLANPALLAQTHSAGLACPADRPVEEVRTVFQTTERDLKTSAARRKRVSQVAVFIDFANILYTAPAHSPQGWLNDTLLNAQLSELLRMGAPFDLYLLSDLFHPKLPDYKVFLFLNSFYLSEAERRRVDARVKRSGQTAIWLWSPGVIGEEGISGELGQRLCGQKMRLEPPETSLRVRITEPNDSLTWGFHTGAQFGEDRPIAPTMTISDRTALRLGANSANKTAFAVRRFDQWTSIVFGAAPAPAALLRNVLRAAGCHLYTELGTVVLADAHSLGLFSRSGGAIKVFLPGIYDVIDSGTGKPLAAAASDCTVTLRPNTSGAYELRPTARKKPQ